MKLLLIRFNVHLSGEMSRQAQKVTNNHCPLKRNRCTVLTEIFIIYFYYYFFILAQWQHLNKPVIPFKKTRPEKNNDNKKIDISNQLICEYYISHTRSADYFMRLIVSVSLGGCLRYRFRLCKNKRALFVWECDSINWMLLIAGVIVQESKNRRKTILTFPVSFVHSPQKYRTEKPFRY